MAMQFKNRLKNNDTFLDNYWLIRWNNCCLNKNIRSRCWNSNFKNTVFAILTFSLKTFLQITRIATKRMNNQRRETDATYWISHCCVLDYQSSTWSRGLIYGLSCSAFGNLLKRLWSVLLSHIERFCRSVMSCLLIFIASFLSAERALDDAATPPLEVATPEMVSCVADILEKLMLLPLTWIRSWRTMTAALYAAST